MKALLAGLGAVLVVFGLVVGLVPHSVERVAAPALTCGSPWQPTTGRTGSPAGTSDAYVDPATKCQAENDVLGSLAASVSAAGALLLVGAGLAVVVRRGRGHHRAGVAVPEPRFPEDELVEMVEMSPYDATPVAREPIS